MNARRSAAALAVSVVLGMTAAPAALADEAPPKTPKPQASALPNGLYGSQDPQYDGVWRQSLALLAQKSVGATPPAAAVDWLTGQQCADGGFAAYRAETSTPCEPKKGEFSDATAAAVQALAAVGGHGASVEKGIGWLKRQQNDDGGWGMNPGSPSDANSTAAVIGAFAATGEDPAKVTSARGSKTPYDALLGLQLGCDAKKDERGAFTYQLQKGKPVVANDLATSAAALAATGKGFLFEPVGKGEDEAVEPLDCGKDDDAKGKRERDDAGEAAAAYLSATMAGHGRHLNSSMPGQEKQADVGGTADAVLALAAGGHREAAAKPLSWLQGNDSSALTWAKDQPAALAKLILASRAAGADPRDFGGTDLLSKLSATGPAAKAPSDTPGETQREQDKKDDKDEKDDDGGLNVWWIVGVGAVAGIGIGFLLSGRKKQQH